MDILVVGGGGREHALAWKLKQSPKVQNLFIAPGNAGTAGITTTIEASKTAEIVAWLKEHPVDLVIGAPDAYLADGLMDEIQKLGIPTFGPTKAAAEIEWSKSFAKDLMLDEGIPTAAFETFTDLTQAHAYIKTRSFPIVIKADGLAAGKGVVIARDQTEAEAALSSMMEERIFGDSGAEVLIEEFMEGREISIHAFCDGETAILFPSSQDHKRIYDNDEGPNTGGMGTIAPVPWVTEELMAEVKEKIVLPALRGLQKRGRPFVGLLYPGLMITKDGPKVVEFNARFGDPEAQPYMRLLKSDLADIAVACAQGKLKDTEVKWHSGAACCVIAASGGYPGKYETGIPILGIEEAEKDPDVVVFHTATKRNGNEVVTAGGRVLGVTATGSDVSEALTKAYAAIRKISFAGMSYRSDIGKKSI